MWNSRLWPPIDVGLVQQKASVWENATLPEGKPKKRHHGQPKRNEASAESFERTMADSPCKPAACSALHGTTHKESCGGNRVPAPPKCPRQADESGHHPSNNGETVVFAKYLKLWQRLQVSVDASFPALPDHTALHHSPRARTLYDPKRPNVSTYKNFSSIRKEYDPGCNFVRTEVSKDHPHNRQQPPGGQLSGNWDNVVKAEWAPSALSNTTAPVIEMSIPAVQPQTAVSLCSSPGSGCFAPVPSHSPYAKSSTSTAGSPKMLQTAFVLSPRKPPKSGRYWAGNFSFVDEGETSPCTKEEEGSRAPTRDLSKRVLKRTGGSKRRDEADDSKKKPQCVIVCCRLFDDPCVGPLPERATTDAHHLRELFEQHGYQVALLSAESQPATHENVRNAVESALYGTAPHVKKPELQDSGVESTPVVLYFITRVVSFAAHVTPACSASNHEPQATATSFRVLTPAFSFSGLRSAAESDRLSCLLLADTRLANVKPTEAFRFTSALHPATSMRAFGENSTTALSMASLHNLRDVNGKRPVVFADGYPCCLRSTNAGTGRRKQSVRRHSRGCETNLPCSLPAGLSAGGSSAILRCRTSGTDTASSKNDPATDTKPPCSQPASPVGVAVSPAQDTSDLLEAGGEAGGPSVLRLPVDGRCANGVIIVTADGRVMPGGRLFCGVPARDAGQQSAGCVYTGGGLLTFYMKEVLSGETTCDARLTVNTVNVFLARKLAKFGYSVATSASPYNKCDYLLSRLPGASALARKEAANIERHRTKAENVALPYAGTALFRASVLENLGLPAASLLVCRRFKRARKSDVGPGKPTTSQHGHEGRSTAAPAARRNSGPNRRNSNQSSAYRKNAAPAEPNRDDPSSSDGCSVRAGRKVSHVSSNGKATGPLSRVRQTAATGPKTKVPGSRLCGLEQRRSVCGRRSLLIGATEANGFTADDADSAVRCQHLPSDKSAFLDAGAAFVPRKSILKTGAIVGSPQRKSMVQFHPKASYDDGSKRTKSSVASSGKISAKVAKRKKICRKVAQPVSEKVASRRPTCVSSADVPAATTGNGEEPAIDSDEARDDTDEDLSQDSSASERSSSSECWSTVEDDDLQAIIAERRRTDKHSTSTTSADEPTSVDPPSILPIPPLNTVFCGSIASSDSVDASNSQASHGDESLSVVSESSSGTSEDPRPIEARTPSGINFDLLPRRGRGCRRAARRSTAGGFSFQILRRERIIYLLLGRAAPWCPLLCELASDVLRPTNDGCCSSVRGMSGYNEDPRTEEDGKQLARAGNTRMDWHAALCEFFEVASVPSLRVSFRVSGGFFAVVEYPQSCALTVHSSLATWVHCPSDSPLRLRTGTLPVLDVFVECCFRADMTKWDRRSFDKYTRSDTFHGLMELQNMEEESNRHQARTDACIVLQALARGFVVRKVLRGVAHFEQREDSVRNCVVSSERDTRRLTIHWFYDSIANDLYRNEADFRASVEEWQAQEWFYIVLQSSAFSVHGTVGLHGRRVVQLTESCARFLLLKQHWSLVCFASFSSKYPFFQKLLLLHKTAVAARPKLHEAEYVARLAIYNLFRPHLQISRLPVHYRCKQLPPPF